MSTACPTCFIDISDVYPPGTRVQDRDREERVGEVSGYSKEDGVYCAKVEFDDPEFNTSYYRPDQLKDHFILLEEGSSSVNVDSGGEDCVYAVKRGSKWVGVNTDQEEVTERKNQLGQVREVFDAPTCKGVGKDDDGNKVYQLIVSPDWAN